jgi:hypothetical protein
MNKWRLFLLLFASAAFAADPLYTGDFEQATAIGPASTSPTAPTTMADFNMSFSCAETWQAKIVDNPARQGKYAIRMYLDDTLPSRLSSDIDRNRERCMINLKPFVDQGIGAYGETRWYAFSIYVPEDAEFEPGDSYFLTTNWQCHAQIMYNDASGTGKGNFHLITETPALGGRWKAEVYAGTDTIPARYVWGSAIQKGTNYDFILKYKFHEQDGQAETTLKYRVGTSGPFLQAFSSTLGNVKYTTLDPYQRIFSWDIGHYRSSDQNGAQALYFDGPWVGLTEADVLPFFEVLAGGTTVPSPTNIQYNE